MALGCEMFMSFLLSGMAVKERLISHCIRGIDSMPPWIDAVYARAYGGLSMLFRNEVWAIGI